jgi:hypothetical protein
MAGTVISYNTGTRALSLDVQSSTGSGSAASWAVASKGMVVLTDPTVRGSGSEFEVRYIAGDQGLATGGTTVTQIGVFATSAGINPLPSRS